MSRLDKARPTRRPRRLAVDLGLALATALLVVASAPGLLPWGWAAFAAWVALAPLLFALGPASPRRAVLLGFVAGLGVNLGLAWWMTGLLARFSGLHPALAALAALGIAVAHAGGWALFALVVRMAPRRAPPWLVAPAAFVALERWLPALFPYSLGLAAYRQVTLAQLAELGGPSALTFLFVLVGGALAAAARARREGARSPWAALGAAGGLVAAALVFGAVRLSAVEAAREPAPTLRFGMVQPDAARSGLSPRRAEGDADALARYQRATADLESQAGEVDLLLWPERALPGLLRRDARHDYPEASRRRIRRGFSSPLLFGLTSVDPRTRALGNSAAILAADGGLRVFYDKVQLILYSEWVPDFATGWVGGGVRYRPGASLEPLVLHLEARPGRPARVARLAVFICFESCFPAHVRRLAARRADLLVNLTDDSWFGETSEPEGHLAQSVFRAIESRRDLLRATASGVSAHIAATGRIVARREVSRGPSAATLVGEARLLELPSASSLLGDGLAWLCALGTLAALLAAASAAVRASRARVAPRRPTTPGSEPSGAAPARRAWRGRSGRRAGPPPPARPGARRGSRPAPRATAPSPRRSAWSGPAARTRGRRAPGTGPARRGEG